MYQQIGRPNRSYRSWCVATVCAFLLQGPAIAQVAAQGDLDSCVHIETAKAAVVGGVGGGALGGLYERFINKKPADTAKGAMVGAIGGAAAGLTYAYYNAVSSCYKKNPAWIPESDIQRTKSFSATRDELKYERSQGIVVRTLRVDMPQTIKPGGTLDIATTFLVMTPDGAETPVTIERKLYGIADGRETELPFTGRSVEQRTFEPGEQTSRDHVPVPSNAKAGTEFRIAYLVSAAGKSPSLGTAKVTVQ